MIDEKKSPIDEFIERLEKLEAADRARLKRNAGNALAESRGVYALFFRLLPYGVPPRHEKWYFLVATLYPLADAGSKGSLGHSLRNARINQPDKDKGFDRRFEVLLDADETQLPFRLRQMVRLLKSAEVSVNWSQLLQDLLSWNHVQRFIQERWARHYYTAQPTEKVTN